jgi:hypothetical protein
MYKQSQAADSLYNLSPFTVGCIDYRSMALGANFYLLIANFWHVNAQLQLL